MGDTYPHQINSWKTRKSETLAKDQDNATKAKAEILFTARNSRRKNHIDDGKRHKDASDEDNRAHRWDGQADFSQRRPVAGPKRGPKTARALGPGSLYFGWGYYRPPQPRARSTKVRALLSRCPNDPLVTATIPEAGRDHAAAADGHTVCPPVPNAGCAGSERVHPGWLAPLLRSGAPVGWHRAPYPGPPVPAAALFRREAGHTGPPCLACRGRLGIPSGYKVAPRCVRDRGYRVHGQRRSAARAVPHLVLRQ